MGSRPNNKHRRPGKRHIGTRTFVAKPNTLIGPSSRSVLKGIIGYGKKW